MSVIGEIKDEEIWKLEKRFKRLEKENEELKEKINQMSALQKVTLVGPEGRKAVAYLDESRQIIYYDYATVELVRHFGYKVVKETEVEECGE